MSGDMRIKLYLDMVNRLAPGAKAATRDLKGVKDAASELKREKGGEAIAEDLKKVAPAGRQAAREIRSVKGEARQLAGERGPQQLAGGLDNAAASARRARRELEATKRAQREFQRNSPLAQLFGPGKPARKEGVNPSRGVAPAAAAALTPGIRGAIGGYFTARAATDSIKRHAEAERAITRIGVTADASKEALAGVGEAAFKVAQEVAMPYDKVVQGLDVLVAQGRTLKDAMAFLPSVARTASAAGAKVDDIARTADSVSSNFKIAGDQMQRAFDIMAAGGKAGQFELKDMARYLPSLGPAAAAAGFKGEEGLNNLVSMLQVMRKGSGTSEEAAASMTNIFQKMESEETSKRFKKFGIGLEKAMAKGRKEGRNLVEVFEELTDTALKGDLSKIPKLFQDQEFARGVRALMSYRGEWQKLSKTIAGTAAGSVAADLDKVTDNVQARLDRLANAYGKRMRQLGAAISDVLVPIDKKIDEVFSGKNEAFNVVEKAAQRYNADIIAREEMQTGKRGDYDAETRRIADARRALLERQSFDDTVTKLDGEIAGKEKILAGRPVRNTRIATEKELIRLKAEREALIARQKARDDANMSLVENEGQRKRLNTRFNRLDAEPGPITPGLTSFGFGPQGQKTHREPLPVETETTAPLPPRRPDSLPKPVPILKDLKEIYAPLSPRFGDTDPARARIREFMDTINMNAEIDLGPAGMTMAEKLNSGFQAGLPAIGATARSVRGVVDSALSGGDHFAAGKSEMESYAAGLKAGTPAVDAAARAAASTVQGAFGRGGRRTLGGALHDGVD